MKLIINNPGILLREVQKELDDVLFLKISISTIYRFLHKNGFTKQKLQLCALQSSEILRQQFIVDVSVYTTDMLVFIDETGTDRRNTVRNYGYSLRGKPLKNPTLFVRGERVSAIACISTAGLLDVKTLTGTTDGDCFYEFTQTHLLPHLMQFNGY